MSEVRTRRLSARELVAARDRIPGLIPVHLDADPDSDQQTLWWRDLGAYHPYEGFFKHTLAALDGLQRLRRPDTPVEHFVTDLDALLAIDVQRDALPPTGLIFHMGRCGSTLLAKSLAQCRFNLVFGEADPHHCIRFAAHGDGGSAAAPSTRALGLYRRLVLAMGRKRVATHRWHFCKLSSFNALFIDAILQTFPRTPALYLYRDPREVLMSFREGHPGWLRYRGTGRGDFLAGPDAIADGDDLGFLGDVLGHCMQTVLDCRAPNLRLLHHGALREQNLPAIWSWLGVDYTVAEQRPMRRQFDRYSKSEFVARPYRPDGDGKRRAPTPEVRALADRGLGPLYEQLASSSRNLLPAVPTALRPGG